MGPRTGALAFSPDGKLLAVLIGGRVSVVNAASGEVTGQLKATEQTDVVFHPDGRRLFATGKEQPVHVWDTSTWTEATSYAWDIGPLQSVAVSADGESRAVVHADPVRS